MMHRMTLTIAFLGGMLTACTDASTGDDTLEGDLGLGCCSSGSSCCNPGTEGEGSGDTPGGGLFPVGLSADVNIEVSGAGLAIGLDPVCGLSLGAKFVASATGSIEYSGDEWTVVDIDSAVSIALGNGCACTGISVSAVASIDLHAEIPATPDGCQAYCSGASNYDACLDVCVQPGNIFTASASIGASVDIGLGGQLDLDGLVGEVVQLGNWVLCNAAGVAI